MRQKFTVLFDLDGTLVDTAPDLMLAHNYVMKKFGYPTKSLEELKSAVGQGAGAMIGRMMLTVDYAYVDYDILNSTNQFAISLKF